MTPAAPTRTRRRLRASLLFPALTLAFLFGACGSQDLPALMAGTPPPSVRIRIGMPRARARLAVTKQAWTVRSLSGSSFALRGGASMETDLTASASGIAVRGRSTGAQILAVEPDDTFTLDGRTYDGRLLVHLVSGQLVLVNELDMETYIAGVIGNEVGPGAEPATYRAQAVAARTYAWMRMQEQTKAQVRFHLYDSAASQVYKGRSVPKQYGIRYGDMVRHTAATRGVIVTHDGRPFRTYYASTCGGHTTEPATSGLDAGKAHEPLRGVACSHCSTSKYFTWTKRLTNAELIAGLKRRKRPVKAPIREVKITKRGRGGWVAEGAIRHGPKGEVRVLPGHEMRSALGLRSNRIESIQPIAGGWVIKGRGWGHGVGMCQWGAIEMGKKGASETEILRYYYPGIAFTKVY
ncbi:MAG: SpoIID/LytB domain-containing protein [Planctomycetota bacterium]|nr:SpoIID/LytB domain-containing protein [Planctomycetota bacterium]